MLEEYTQEEIDRFRFHINACIKEVQAALEFRDRVLTEYEKLGLSIHINKAEVMRASSQHFRREEMKKVYSVLMKNV